MGTTIFYNYKLKRTRCAEEVFAKMTKAIKKKGVTKRWKCELCDGVIFLDFGDGRSETFVLNLKEKSGEGFCKVAFDTSDDEEIREKAMDTFLDMLYSLRTSFSSFDITDDYEYSKQYFDSKKYKIKLRELKASERERLDRLYNSGYHNHEELLLGIMAEDLGLPQDFDWTKDIPDKFKKFSEFDFPNIFEWYLSETCTYKGRKPMKFTGCDLSTESFSVLAFAEGMYQLMFETYCSVELFSYNSFGEKHAQIKKFFINKFIGEFIRSDEYKRCELSYRFLLSAIECLGFTFVGKKNAAIIPRKEKTPLPYTAEQVIKLRVLNEQEEKIAKSIYEFYEKNKNQRSYVDNFTRSTIMRDLIVVTNKKYKEYYNPLAFSYNNNVGAIKKWLDCDSVEPTQKDYLNLNIFETWLLDTASYGGKRLIDMSREEYLSDEVQHAVGGYVLSVCYLDLFKSKGFVDAFRRKYGDAFFCIYEEYILPIMAAKSYSERCTTAYRFILTLYDYFGFTKVGLKPETEKKRRAEAKKARDEQTERDKLPKLEGHHCSLSPCMFERSNVFFAINEGGVSKGLGIAISVYGLENDDVYFSDIQLEYALNETPRKVIPLNMKKRKKPDGGWELYWEDKDFILPEKIDPNLWICSEKYYDETDKRIFGVRFTPHGDQSKQLDISVTFIPLEYPDGKYEWCVRERYNSNRA